MEIKEEVLNKAHTVIHSKNTRNIVFLIISVLSVLMINSLLPVIKGSAHYTESPEEGTYSEYISAISHDENINLTWKSKVAVKAFPNKFTDKYVKSHEGEYPTDEMIQDALMRIDVTYYTRFFFNNYMWYVSTGVQMLSVLIIYYSVLNFLISRKKQKDERYIDLKKKVQESTDNSLDPCTFDPWMRHVFNKGRKERQHISNVRYKIDKLYDKTSYKVRHLPLDNRKRRKYEMKRATLEEQLSSAYIEKHVEGKRVKGFVYIYPTFVLSGTNATSMSTDEYSLIKSDGQKIGGDGITKVLTSIGLTFGFSLLLTFTVSSAAEEPWYWILMNIVVKLAPMLIQVTFAYDYSESFMENQLIANLVSRRNIALLYMADMRNTTLKEMLKNIDNPIKANGKGKETDNGNKDLIGYRPADTAMPINRGTE